MEAFCFPPPLPCIFNPFSLTPASYEVIHLPIHVLHQRPWKGSIKIPFPSFHEPFASSEVTIMLMLVFPATFMFFLLSISSTHSQPVFPFSSHCVLCDFWIDCRVEIFGFRSVLLCLVLHDTCLTSGFTGVLRLHRWPPRLQPPPLHRHVACTRQGVCLPFRRVPTTSSLPDFLHDGFWWFSVDPAFPAGVRPSSGGAWSSRASAGSFRSIFLSRFSVVVLSVVFSIVFLRCLGYCFPLWKTFVFGIVLDFLLSAVIFSDFNSVLTIAAIFWWLLQVSSGDAVGLVLICFPFTFVTALCEFLKGPGHLFVKFPIFCLYFSVVSVWFGSNVGEPTLFSLIGLLSSFSFWIRGRKDPLL
jgi:hypothetical protein